LANSNEHVPEVEQNNRTLQEQMRVIFHSLPFQAIPAILIRYLASETAEKLKFFPAIGGISSYYSPHKILTKQSLDYEKHCTIPQFSYVLAHGEPSPKNTQASCKLDCIYLHPVHSQQVSHCLYNLATNQVLSHRQVTVIPMTAAVIEIVQQLAKEYGMNRLALHSKDGKLFYDSTWIAGVDYTDDFYDDIYQDQDYEDKEQQDTDLEAQQKQSLLQQMTHWVLYFGQNIS